VLHYTDRSLAIGLAADASPAEAPSPAALLRDLTPKFPLLGITRLASQTGLDRTGIPCYAAIRPNSLTIASHQGKGVSETAAKLSAIMEAAEYAVAEAPEAPVRVLSLAQVREAGHDALDVESLLPRGFVIDPDLPIRWIEAHELSCGAPVLVPYDAVALGPPPDDLPAISQSTNGLAAGTSMDRALLHALCELIERDAVCLWGFKSDAAAFATAVAPEMFGDREVDELVARIVTAGYAINLFDLSTDTGVPVVYAVMFPAHGADRHFDAASGAACHPVASVAAAKAIVEAAQTHITNIAGARDDIVGAEYDTGLSRSIRVLTEARPSERPAPMGLVGHETPAALLRVVRDGLRRARLERIVTVRLGSSRLGVEVVKAFVPGLEDRLTNKHWRPGPRAAAAMLGAL
jgi:ribosomal protein S12 methylthiotransferase accessory factor